VAASGPQWWAASARVVPWPTPGVRRTDGQLAAEQRAAVVALRAAPTRAARPVARRYAARRAPRAERPRRAVRAPGEEREPHGLRGRRGGGAPARLPPRFPPPFSR